MCIPSFFRAIFVALTLMLAACIAFSGFAIGEEAKKPAEAPPPAAAPDKAAAEKAAAEKAAAEKAAAEKAAAEKAAAEKAAAEKATAEKATAEKAAAEKAAPKPEPRLRFQFRFQRWADVLEWFAKQADLSLVLDAPPPGTFNFSDTREYTPAEALDLLNGVLQTKDYTLIRRDRMLMVINLKDGIPEGVVPQVTVEDLDKRGKFELVTVRFPLGSRPVDTVVKEITPLLGAHGKVAPLPATSQVQVTDMAGIMRAVQAVIQSVPEPKPPAPAAPGETPIMAHYPIKPADAATVQAAFKALLPDVKVACDAQGDQVHVFAMPSQQAIAKTLMDDMRSGNAADKQSRLELYPLSETLGARLLPFLRNVAPNAVISIDSKKGKVAAWASAADQEIIKQTIEKLRGGGIDGADARLEAYRLTGADPTAAIKLLEDSLPDAKLTLDPDSGNLLAWATPGEHKRIAEALAKLGSAPGQEEMPQVQTFRLTKANPTTTLALLKTLVPHAKLSLDPTAHAIVAVASTADRKIIEETLTRLQPAQPDQNTPELSFYTFKQQPPAELLAVLKDAVPQATLKLDTDGKRLSIVATPGDQAFLKTLLERYEKNAPPEEKSQLAVYTVTPEQKTRFAAVLAAMASELPDAKVVADADPTQLTIWAKPEQHKTIRATLDQLRQDAAEIEIFRLTKANPATTLQLLHSLVPGAKLSLDPTANSIVALATADERKIIAETLARLQPTQPDQNTPELSFHTFKQQPPAELLAVLKDAVPQATLKLDTDGKRLSIVATPSDQAFLKTLLERYEKNAPPEERNQLALYAVTPEQKTRFQAVMATAAPDLPGIKVVADADPTQLAIWAKPEQHAIIRGIIDQLCAEPAAEQKSQLVVYSMKTADPTNVATMLAPIYPTAKFVPEKKTRKIAVWARPDEHAAIKKAIEEIDSGAPGDVRKVQSYESPTADPQVAIGLLEDIVPAAELQGDLRSHAIIARATARDQEQIQRTLEQMRVENSPAQEAHMEVYPLDNETPGPMVAFLQSLVPTAKLKLDHDTQSLAVWGTKKEQETVREAIAKFNGGVGPAAGGASSPLDAARQVEVYPLTKADPTSTLALLKTLVPRARISVDYQTRRLIALASVADQKIIRSTVEQLQPEKPGPDEPVLQLYTLKQPAAATMLTSLQTLAPTARLTLDPDGKRLTVVARPADQELIKKNMEQFEQSATTAGTEQLLVFPLQRADPLTILPTLTRMFPHAEWTPDKKGRRLTAITRFEDPAAMRAAVEKLDAPRPGDSVDVAETVASYPIETDPRAVVEMLQDLFPQMMLSVDYKGKAIVAKGTGQDQKALANIVTKLDAPDERLRPRVVSYSTGEANPVTLRALILQLVPSATVTADEKTHSLVVLATPKEHEAIRAAVEQLGKTEPAGTAPAIASYLLPNAGAVAALRVLTPALPEAHFSIGSDPQQLLAYARPADQAIIKAAVEQMESEDLLKDKRVLAVYSVPVKDATTIRQIFDPTVLKNAKIVPLADREGVLVWAESKQQEVIKKALDEFKKQLPNAQEATTKVYRLQRADPRSLLMALTPVLPNARLAIDVKGRTLVASALPEDHEKIAAAVADMDSTDPATDEQLCTYRLPRSGAVAALRVLAPALPRANFSVGADPQQLIAYASPADQAIVKKAVEQMESDDLLNDTRVMAVYAVPVKDARTLSQIFDPSVLKNAKIVPLDNREGVLVWADAKQQEVIKKALDEFKKQLPNAQEATTKVYRLVRADPRSLLTALTPVLPNAKLAVDAKGRTLVATALPEDHEKIAAAVTEMDRSDPHTDAQLCTYMLTRTGALAAMRVLNAAMPDAEFSVGADPRQLIAYARPAVQEVIKAAIDQMESDDVLSDNRVLAVYSAPYKDAAALAQVLDPGTLKNATIVPMPNRGGILVWAEPKQQEAIKKAMDSFQRELANAVEPTAQVYRFRHADPRAALAALAPLLPNAKIAIDANGRALVATAIPEDHEKIAATVAELDREDAATDAALRVHYVKVGDPQNLLTVLHGLFRGRPEVQISLDAQNDAIVAVATPEEHKTIDDLLAQVEKGIPGEKGVTLETYPLENIEGRGIVAALTTLLQKQGGNVELSVEPYSRQLVALAKPEQQRIIRQTLDALRGGTQTLDILQLEHIEPTTAETAIRQLFADDRMRAPTVETDYSTEQLFVRGTPEQLQKIRELLAKMGETGLGVTTSSSAAGAMRTIPFHGDAAATVEQIQRMWPQLSKNPLRVVTPSAVAPILRQEREKAEQQKPAPAPQPAPAAPKDSAPASKDSAPAPAKDKQSACPRETGNLLAWCMAGMLCGQTPPTNPPAAAPATAQPVAPAETKPAVPAPAAATKPAPAAAQPATTEAKTEAKPAPAKPAAPEAQPVAAAPAKPTKPSAPAPQPAPTPTAAPAAAPAAPAPVVLAVSGDNIVIASDDPQALAQMESLLRTLGGETPSPGRNYSIYALKHAAAADVADMLQSLFRTNRHSGVIRGLNSVTIVPDERTNSILVQASRADRSTIESYLKILDAEESPAAVNAMQPLTVVLQNASAARVEEMLRTVFRSQLTPASGARRATAGSSGLVPTELAIDQATNSLIIVAPPSLAQRLAEFARSLDASAVENPAREVSIVPLKNTNATRVQEVLDLLIDQPATHRRTPRHR